MGMYTELAIGVEFKSNLPEEVRAALDFMVTEEGEAPTLNHPLFQTERWRWMLRSGGSYYFDAQPCLVWRYDDIARAWFLTVWTNIKNYTEEWQHFLDFIAPYVDTDGYIGTYRYENDDDPTILYVEHGRIVHRYVAR